MCVCDIFIRIKTFNGGGKTSFYIYYTCLLTYLRVKTTIIGVRLIGRVVVNIKTCVVIFVASVPWDLYAFGRCVFLSVWEVGPPRRDQLST